MKIITFLRSIFSRVVMTLVLFVGLTTTALSQISPKQEQAQEEGVLSNPLLSSRFSVEGSLGLMFSSGQNPRGLIWLNKLIRDPYVDLEIAMRFPLSDNTVWYTGLQGAFYDSYAPTTSFAGGWRSDYSQGKIVTHGGIEYVLGGGLRMRSTLGAGMLWGNALTRIITISGLESQAINDVQSFTMSIRQNIMYDINSVLSTGVKFEQTFSQYDNFFSAGLVVGMRF